MTVDVAVGEQIDRTAALLEKRPERDRETRENQDHQQPTALRRFARKREIEYPCQRRCAYGNQYPTGQASVEYERAKDRNAQNEPGINAITNVQYDRQ